MLAFHNDETIKSKYLERVRAHGAADEIIHGIYWERGKGCAVGCTVHSSEHSAYEDELGIPLQIAYLEDRIFEGLDNGSAHDFPEEFLRSIRVGSDLAGVIPRFMVWLLTDDTNGVIRFGSPIGKVAIQLVSDLYQRILDGGTVEQSEWNEVRRAAADAADAAADAARQKAYSAMKTKLLELLAAA